MVDKLNDILLKILTNLSQWLYNIQVNRYSKNLPSIEVIDINSKFDINELSLNGSDKLILRLGFCLK